MDLRHACHLIAEALNDAGASLLAADAGTVRASVVALGEESGFVLLDVDFREYELVVRERKRRPVAPGDEAAA